MARFAAGPSADTLSFIVSFQSPETRFFFGLFRYLTFVLIYYHNNFNISMLIIVHIYYQRFVDCA